jgi:hypothetical protein
MNRTLLRAAQAFVILAFASSAALLARNLKMAEILGLRTAAISALPLLAVGLSFLAVQPIIRPQRAELLKNLLLAATFLLWGVVQLMAPNSLSKTLEDMVIVLYVADLAWTVLAKVNAMEKSFD